MTPPRNDGKGVTEEGKQELRSLLDSLTKQNSVPTNTHTSKPSTSSPEPVQDSGTKKKTELSETEMREMLSVEKPNLE
jgi:hypothetical protein